MYRGCDFRPTQRPCHPPAAQRFEERGIWAEIRRLMADVRPRRRARVQNSSPSDETGVSRCAAPSGGEGGARGRRGSVVLRLVAFDLLLHEFRVGLAVAGAADAARTPGGLDEHV